MTTCAYCNLALEGWESDDNPLYVSKQIGNRDRANENSVTSITDASQAASSLRSLTSTRPLRRGEPKQLEPPRLPGFLCSQSRLLPQPHLTSSLLPTSQATTTTVL